MTSTAMERFWSKVEITPSCWSWKAATSRGYGRFHYERRIAIAHKYSFELANGPVPDGMDVDHTCHNRACVNPAHLRLATRKQNLENRQGPTKNSKSGIRGVTWSPANKRWEAFVGHDGKVYRAGSFLTAEEAEKAVIRRRNELFTHNDKDRIADVSEPAS